MSYVPAHGYEPIAEAVEELGRLVDRYGNVYQVASVYANAHHVSLDAAKSLLYALAHGGGGRRYVQRETLRRLRGLA